MVVEWVAVENLRSAVLHCQYRALSLFHINPPSFSGPLSRSLSLSSSPYFSLSLSVPFSLSLSFSFSVHRSLRFGSLALFIFLSIALCGMKLSLLVAGVMRVGVPRALLVTVESRASARARIYTPGVSAACVPRSHRCRGAVAACVEWRR